MRRLRADPVNLTRRGVGSRRKATFRLALPLLALASAALLLLSRIDHSATRALASRIADVMAPVIGAAIGSRDALWRFSDRLKALVSADTELERLRRENTELKEWRNRAAELQGRIEDLARVAHAPIEGPWEHLTVRVIADSGGTFARSVVVNAGRDHGLRIGFPVITNDGLVGRVVEAGRRSASVLMVTDLASRIPVIIGRDKVRAVMAGEAAGAPRLTFITGGTVVDGDDVVTSGTGGVFPRGLKVGNVRVEEGAQTVRLAARLDQIDHVKVLLYESSAQEFSDDTGVRRSSEVSQRRGAVLPGTEPDGARR